MSTPPGSKRVRLHSKTSPPETALVEPSLPFSKRLRLRSKTPLPQTPVVGISLGAEASKKQGRSVYLVTLPHPKQTRSECGRTLVAPESMSKKELMQKFLICCQNPVYIDPQGILERWPVPLRRAGLWNELHEIDAAGEVHGHSHLAVLAERVFKFMPVKRALLQRYGLASHWSSAHDGYWSPVRYLSVPSPKKPYASLDHHPELWAAKGKHPPVSECVNPPMTADAIRARRQYAEMKCAEAGKKQPRVSEMDVWPVVVANKIRNTPDSPHADKQLMAWVKNYGTVEMQQFCFKQRAKLKSLIDDIWMWENVENDVQIALQSRMQVLTAAATSPCVCSGAWAAQVAESFRVNGINASELCGDILTSMKCGRSEQVPVIVLAGARGGEGKSMFLKPMLEIFGHEAVFCKPEKGNFPLVDLPGKKVAFLDEWRFDESIISYATQCVCQGQYQSHDTR